MWRPPSPKDTPAYEEGLLKPKPPKVQISHFAHRARTRVWAAHSSPLVQPDGFQCQTHGLQRPEACRPDPREGSGGTLLAASR